jgi:predicted DNA-binding protein (MmcQ/YjbR family)
MAGVKMDYSELLSNRTLKKDEALAYGFKENTNGLVLTRNLKEDGLALRVTISPSVFEAVVFDTSTNEEYGPFSLPEANGDFVVGLRQEAETIINEIAQVCFILNDVKARTLDYIKEKYGALIDNPWTDLPNFTTVKEKKNGKWFALFMDLPLKRIGIDKESIGWVLNVKANPEEIDNLVDHVYVFPAYHMSKKNWVTILLSSSTPFDLITRLIDESFDAVTKKK